MVKQDVVTLEIGTSSRLLVPSCVNSVRKEAFVGAKSVKDPGEFKFGISSAAVTAEVSNSSPGEEAATWLGFESRTLSIGPHHWKLQGLRLLPGPRSGFRRLRERRHPEKL